MSRVRTWLARLAPYVIAGVAITLVLRKYSIDSIRTEMSRGTTWPLIPIAVATFVLTLVIMTVADRMVCKHILGGPRALDILRARAATVLLHIIHYTAGQGAYAIWIARKTGASAGVAGGVILYIMAGELASVCLFTTLAIVIADPAIPGPVLPFVAITAGVLGLLILIGPFRLPLSKLADRLAIFRPWTRGSRRWGLAQIGVRLIQNTLATLGTIWAARAFGLDIPAGVLFAFLPIIGLVNAMPVNIAGIGAVQAAWLLLEPWAPGEQILAFSVIWSLVAGAVLVLRGLPFVRGVTSEIRRGAPIPKPSRNLPRGG